MLLPKGIVFNHNRVYKEVASFPVVPSEKIIEYWHVYTTTFGKLKDPTANRLENFWWHVMGSDRRMLSGQTLAKIFEQISNGPTFVPLRGPPNRYEGPIPTMAKNLLETLSQNDIQRLQPVSSDGRSDQGTVKAIPSSSSKPPPAHPILKKPRGPSSSGPRPTARFISPAGSDAEDDKKESEADSSTSTAGTMTSHLKPTNASAMKDRHKKPVGGVSKKKIVASSSKRRPAIPRRQSSQSSATSSEVGSREERASLTSRYPVSQRSVSPIAERPSKTVATKPQDVGDRLSIKAAGKRPAVTSMGVSEPATFRVPVNNQGRSVIVQNTQSPQRKPQAQGKEPVYDNVQFRGRQAGPPHEKNDGEEQTRTEAATSTSNHPRSDIDIVRATPRESKVGRRGLPQGLTSTSTATTSTVAAQGTIIEFDENAPARAVTSAMQEDLPEVGLQRSGSSVTLTPTVPSKTPIVPLGRSKSQLTLLLERQGEKKPRR